MGCCASCCCDPGDVRKLASRLPEPLQLIALRFDAVITHSDVELDVASACSFGPVVGAAASAVTAAAMEKKAVGKAIEPIAAFLRLLWSMASSKSSTSSARWLSALDACVWMAVRPGSGCPAQVHEALLCSPKGIASLMHQKAKKDKSRGGTLREVVSGWALENEELAKQPLIQKWGLEPAKGSTSDTKGDAEHVDDELGTDLDQIRVTVGEPEWWDPDSSEALAILGALVRVSAVQGSLCSVIADIGSTLSVGDPRASFVREVVIAVLWSFGSELLYKIGTAAVDVLRQFGSPSKNDDSQSVAEEQAVALLEATIQVLAKWLGDSSDSAAAIINEAATTVATFDTAIAAPRRARADAAGNATGAAVTGAADADDDSSSGEESAALARISLHVSPAGAKGSPDTATAVGDALPEPPRGFVIVEEALLLGLRCRATRKVDMQWVAAVDGPRLTALRRSVAPGGAARSTVVEFLLHQLAWKGKPRSGASLHESRPYSYDGSEERHVGGGTLGVSDTAAVDLGNMSPSSAVHHDADTDDMEYKKDRRLQDLFNQCDRNADGRVSKIELIKVCASNPDIAELFHLPQKIRQEDGTRDEFERIFQGIDANEDRAIDWEEFRSFFAGYTKATEQRTTDQAASPTGDSHGAMLRIANADGLENSSEGSCEPEACCLLLPKRQLQKDLALLQSKGFVVREPAEEIGAAADTVPLLAVGEGGDPMEMLRDQEDEEEEERMLEDLEGAADFEEGSSHDPEMVDHPAYQDHIHDAARGRDHNLYYLSDAAEFSGDMPEDMGDAAAIQFYQEPTEPIPAQFTAHSGWTAEGHENYAEMMDRSWEEGDEFEGAANRDTAEMLPSVGQEVSQDLVWEPSSEPGTMTPGQALIQSHHDPDGADQFASHVRMVTLPESVQEHVQYEGEFRSAPPLDTQTHFHNESMCVSPVMHIPGDSAVEGSSPSALHANFASAEVTSLHAQVFRADARETIDTHVSAGEVLNMNSSEFLSAADIFQLAIGSGAANSTADAAAGAAPVTVDGHSALSAGEVLQSRYHDTTFEPAITASGQMYSVGEVRPAESASQLHSLSQGEIRTMDRLTSRYSIGEVSNSEASALMSKSHTMASAVEDNCQTFEAVPEESEAAADTQQDSTPSQTVEKPGLSTQLEAEAEPKCGAGPLPPCSQPQDVPERTARPGDLRPEADSISEGADALLHDSLMLNGFSDANGVPGWAPEGLDPDFIAAGQSFFAALDEALNSSRTPPTPLDARVVEEIAMLRNQVDHLRTLLQSAPHGQAAPDQYAFNPPAQFGVPPQHFLHPAALQPCFNVIAPHAVPQPVAGCAPGGVLPAGGQLPGHLGAPDIGQIAAMGGQILQAAAQLGAAAQVNGMQQFHMGTAMSPAIAAAAAQLYAAHLGNTAVEPVSSGTPAVPATPRIGSATDQSPATVVSATPSAKAVAAVEQTPARAPTAKPTQEQATSLEMRLGDIASEMQAKLRDLTGELGECKRQLQMQQASTAMLTNELIAGSRQQCTPRGKGLVETLPQLNLNSPRLNTHPWMGSAWRERADTILQAPENPRLGTAFNGVQPAISSIVPSMGPADMAAGASSGADLAGKGAIFGMDTPTSAWYLHTDARALPEDGAGPISAHTLASPRGFGTPAGGWAGAGYDPLLQQTTRGVYGNGLDGLHHLSSVGALASARGLRATIERPQIRGYKDALSNEMGHAGRRKTHASQRTTASAVDSKADLPAPSLWQLRPDQEKLEQDLRGIDRRLQGLDGMFKSMLT